MMTRAPGLFLWELKDGTRIEAARTRAVNAVVVAEIFHLLNNSHILASVLSEESLTGNPYVLLAITVCIPLQIARTHAPVMLGIFESTDLSALAWIKLAGAGLLVFCVAEF